MHAQIFLARHTDFFQSASALAHTLRRSPGYAPPGAGDLMKRKAVWGLAPGNRVDRDASDLADDWQTGDQLVEGDRILPDADACRVKDCIGDGRRYTA